MSEMKSNDSLMKILLTRPMTQSAHSALVRTTVASCDNFADDIGTKLISFFNQASSAASSSRGNGAEKETDTVLREHCYSRPWNWRPESSYMRPTKTLFMAPSGNNSASLSHNRRPSNNEENELIDVDTVPPDPKPIYEVEKAKNIMEESMKQAILSRTTDDSEIDWEEMVPKNGWTTNQSQLFTSMAKILSSDRLARLAHEGSWNEPIQRRAIVDKSVERTRLLMASISWDVRLTQWLHSILVEYLSIPYLAAYLDILQSLRAKVPAFLEKMMFGSNSSTRLGTATNESLFPLLKRPWDPVIGVGGLRKLPGNPVLVVVPPGPGPPGKRTHKLLLLLSTLGHVVCTGAPIPATTVRLPLPVAGEQMVTAARAKLLEVRTDWPGRPIVLVGINTGSAVAVQAIDGDLTTAFVCLGFPLSSMQGPRGQPDDILLDVPCPTMFVVGQCAHRANAEDVEDVRGRMRMHTALAVVGGADDQLRVSRTKRRVEGITQSIVDRCVMDEISEFVGSVLLCPPPPLPPLPPPPQQVAPPPPQPITPGPPITSLNVPRSRPTPVNIDSGTTEMPVTKSLTSISSQISLQHRGTRPVGRPPGSGKKRIQHIQMQVGGEVVPVSQSTTVQGPVSLPTLPQQHTITPVASSHPLPPHTRPTIKVLENTVLTSGRTIDISRLMILPDGTRCVRTAGSARIRPPAPAPPPTTQAPSLSSLDIMDLPIIFADTDAQLVNNSQQIIRRPTQQTLTNINSLNKMVIINKQVMKRPMTTNSSTQPLKYAKIIVSKPLGNRVQQQGMTVVPATTLPAVVDLEAELKASKVVRRLHVS